MKKYSLAICKTNSSDYQVIKWYDLKQIMQNQQVTEAIVFPVADAASEYELAKRYLIGKIIIEKDRVKHLDECCLVDHENGDQLLPCMILLDPDLPYAVVKAMEFRANKSFIQCVLKPDNSFIVNECNMAPVDERFNIKVN